MAATAKVKIQSTVEVTSGTSVWHMLRVSRESVAPIGLKGNLRRVVCTLNGTATFKCSLFPSKGDYFLTLNKKLRDKLGLQVGDRVTVELIKDESKYGMPMPRAFAEVLRQDEEGDRLFKALTPGNQRLILKLIAAVKHVDKRIHRALLTMEHLKEREGKFDWHALNESFKRPLSEDDFRKSGLP